MAGWTDLDGLKEGSIPSPTGPISAVQIAAEEPGIDACTDVAYHQLQARSLVFHFSHACIHSYPLSGQRF